jgi:hypothetical protein
LCMHKPERKATLPLGFSREKNRKKLQFFFHF